MKARNLIRNWKALAIIAAAIAVVGLLVYFLAKSLRTALIVVASLAAAFVLWLLVQLLVDFFRSR